jgi:hypothetical protein
MFHIKDFFKGHIIRSRGEVHLLNVLLGCDVIVVDCTGITTRCNFLFLHMGEMGL